MTRTTSALLTSLLLLTGCAHQLHYQQLLSVPRESGDARMLRVERPGSFEPIEGAAIQIGDQKLTSDANGLITAPAQAENAPESLVAITLPAGVERYEIFPVCQLQPAELGPTSARIEEKGCDLSCDHFVLAADCRKLGVVASVTFGVAGFDAAEIGAIMVGNFTEAVEQSIGNPVQQTPLEVVIDGRRLSAVSLSARAEGFSMTGLALPVGDVRRPRVLMCTQENGESLEECRSILEALYLRTGPQALKVLEGAAR